MSNQATRPPGERKPLLIGELARRAGISPDTIRFYERAGLMPRPDRSGAGYRHYTPECAARLGFIRKAQALGMSLDEVKRLLRLRESGTPPCGLVIEFASGRLRKVELELAGLQRFRDSLKGWVRRWKRTANPKACAAASFCNLIEELDLEPALPPRGSEMPVKPRR